MSSEDSVLSFFFKRQPGEHIVLRIVKLLLNKLLLRRLLDDIFGQRVRIAYRTVHHAGYGIRALAHNADYFKLYTVGVQRFKSKLIAADVLVFAVSGSFCQQSAGRMRLKVFLQTSA